MGDAEELQQSLFNLQLLQSKFCSQINDLKALRHSIKDAVSHSQATEGDHEKLETELAILANLREEYQAAVNEFNFRFGWKQEEKTTIVNKSLEENISAARNVKVNVEMLMRKVKRQLAGSDQQEQEIEVENSNDSDLVDEKEEITKNEADNKEKDSEGNQHKDNEDKDESSSWVKKALTIGGGILIVIMFYLGLGAAIKIVKDNMEGKIGEGEAKSR